MSKCSVCARPERADIDVALSFQVVNLSKLARDFGVSRDALKAHRSNHLPQFLPAFQAQASALTLDTLQAEAQRLYTTTLDALARVEAGVLTWQEETDPATGERKRTQVRRVSATSVARMIREARAGLDQLTRLAADRGDQEGRPSSAADIALGDEIRTQLARVVARRAAAVLDVDDTPDASALKQDVPSLGGGPPLADIQPPGAPTGSTPPASAPSFPIFSAIATETPEVVDAEIITPPAPVAEAASPDPSDALTDEQVRMAAGAIGLTADAFLAHLRQMASKTPVLRHPEWTGSEAATKEERAAEGYADVPIQDHRYDT